MLVCISKMEISQWNWKLHPNGAGHMDTIDLLSTCCHWLQMIYNSIYGQCFGCHNIWEHTTHVPMCSCTACTTAHTHAQATFQQKLSCMHMPNIITNLICASMESWLDCHSNELTQHQLQCAFHAQSQSGWDQFFQERIARAWQLPIDTYNKQWQPGASFTLDQWMEQ
jgi:hypothetical protein